MYLYPCHLHDVLLNVPSYLQASVIRAECELVAPEHGDQPPLVTELPVTAEAGLRT